MHFNNENFRKTSICSSEFGWGFFNIVLCCQSGAEGIRVLSKKSMGNISLIEPEQDNVNIKQGILK